MNVKGTRGKGYVFEYEGPLLDSKISHRPPYGNNCASGLR
jgi:hypothetical protein